MIGFHNRVMRRYHHPARLSLSLSLSLAPPLHPSRATIGRHSAHVTGLAPGRAAAQGEPGGSRRRHECIAGPLAPRRRARCLCPPSSPPTPRVHSRASSTSTALPSPPLPPSPRAPEPPPTAASRQGRSALGGGYCARLQAWDRGPAVSRQRERLGRRVLPWRPECAPSFRAGLARAPAARRRLPPRPASPSALVLAAGHGLASPCPEGGQASEPGVMDAFGRRHGRLWAAAQYALSNKNAAKHGMVRADRGRGQGHMQ